jgi:hypothetical protein
MHALFFVVDWVAAQNLGWNYPKEEFHSIQPYRLIGVDRRRPACWISGLDDITLRLRFGEPE